MTHTFAKPAIHADPLIRSTVYKLLSLGFKYPNTEIFKAFQNGEYLSELQNTMSSLPHLKSLLNGHEEIIRKIGQDLQGATLQDLQLKYTQAFDVGVPEPPCPPYEGVYRGGIERTVTLIEVSEFYKQFGLKMHSEEEKRELADHLCAELEFLHFLTFKENQAREEGNKELLKGYIWAQKDFLELHLAKWVPKFTDKLQTSCADPLYVPLANITSKFVTSEFELVKSMFEEFGNEQDSEENENG